jgi:poly(U)-specific endoribonuclease
LWKGFLKPVSTSFIGVSPEFELALYTLCFLAGGEETPCLLGGEHDVVVRCHKIGRCVASSAARARVRR